MSHDHADLALTMLADDNAALVERIIDLMIERDRFRELSQAAVHALHDLNCEQDRLRERHQRLVDEYRALRERMMRDRETAA